MRWRSKKDVVLHLRWSRANENLFATTGCPGKISSQLLIHHLGHPQVSEKPVTACNVLQRSRLIPFTDVVSAGGDRVGRRGVGAQLAPDAAALRDRR